MPARELWVVRWEQARLPDEPNQRVRKEWTFHREEDAGAQIDSVRMWSPKFMELLGVWRSAGWQDGAIQWEAVDPDTVKVDPAAEWRHRTIAAWSPGHAEMMGAETDG